MTFFKTNKEIKKYLPASLALNFADVAPYIEDVAREEILPILGQQLYDLLIAAYPTADVAPVDANFAKLLHEVRRPLAALSIAKYIPLGSVNVSSTGIHEVQDDNMRSATKWRTEKLEKSLLDEGQKKLDDLFVFLEANFAQFPTWKSSDSFSLLVENFVYKTTIFNKHYNINNSRRVFVSLKSIMGRVELDSVLPILFKNLFDEIKTQIKDNNLTDENKLILLNYIQPAVCFITISMALQQRSVFLDENGVTIFKTLNTQAFTERNDAPDARVERIASQLMINGQGILETLTNFLKDNINDYPTLGAEENYDPTLSTTLINSSSKKSFRGL